VAALLVWNLSDSLRASVRSLLSVLLPHTVGVKFWGCGCLLCSFADHTSLSKESTVRLQISFDRYRTRFPNPTRFRCG
jgi:uncharacterized Fe-S cluster-containing MiaB family protein